MTESFKEKVLRLVKSFSKEEAAYFAWLCAVRALPFLSVGKLLFSYWKEENRQSNLYAIFNAFDISANYYVAHISAANVDAYEAYIVTKAAANVTYNFKNYGAARAAHDVAGAAANAARAVTKFAPVGDFATAAAIYAADAAAATFADKEVFENIILKDIETIAANGICPRPPEIGIYGDIWHNFQKDLVEAGCPYWANLYSNLFENNFAIDKEELKRRLNVPDEIKEQGAAAVGRYLEGPEEEVKHLNEARVIIARQDFIDKGNGAIPLNFTYNSFNMGGNQGNITFINDHSTAKIEVRDSVINLHGELNSLMKDLRNKAFAEDADYIEVIVNTIEEAREIIDSVPEDEVEEHLRKKGLVTKIREFYNELTDENSNLYKNTVKLRNGAKRVRSVLKVYNDFAKLIPVLPQVPDAVLEFGK